MPLEITTIDQSEGPAVTFPIDGILRVLDLGGSVEDATIDPHVHALALLASLSSMAVPRFLLGLDRDRWTMRGIFPDVGSA